MKTNRGFNNAKRPNNASSGYKLTHQRYLTADRQNILVRNCRLVTRALCFVELLPQWSYGRDKAVLAHFRPEKLGPGLIIGSAGQ